MEKSIKKIIIDLMPPAILRRYRVHARKYGFFDEYLSWEKAKENSTGYDSDVIIDKIKESALMVRGGNAVYERDGKIMNEIHYSWPVLASLLWIASQETNKLSVVDFGGSLGTSYFQNRNFLKHLSLSWNIVEQPKFVNLGKKLFQDNQLKFYEDIESAMNNEKPSTIILSSSLQYIPAPYEILSEILNHNPKYVIFDKTPFLHTPKDHLTVQKVPPHIYDASYPCWIFGLDKFLSFLKQYDYQLVAELDSFQKDIFKLKNNMVDWKGFLFIKNTNE